MKEQDKISDFKQKIAQEHELRLQTEKKAVQAINELADTQELLKKSSAYNSYLESKYADLEAEFASQSTKLNNSVNMLSKAKQLILQRKTELNSLKEENAKLKAALSKKTELLNAEMIQHEQTNHKLATTLRKLSDLQKDELQLNDRPIDNMEEYFAYKILTAPKNEMVSDQSLKSDTDFMAQLKYIEQQYLQKT